MARRSILSPAREEQAIKPDLAPAPPPEAPARSGSKVKPSRWSKLHIGGYYNPDDASIISFQKLGIDLRKSQQEMLLEAIQDFVAKHQASRAFE